jgi:hypothetical protein
MYYPLLRARQFELIALRELASEQGMQGVITPILEPVKESHNNLTLAHKSFQENGQTSFLIINPTIGETKGDQSFYIEYLSDLDSTVFSSAFHYKNNSSFINLCIDKFGLSNCMILCPNDVNSDDDAFRQLVARSEVSSINVNDPNRNRNLNRFVKGLNKNYIRLDDLFERQARNSDYLKIQEHKFSEEHIYYNEDGFSGFSDYSILASEYIEGGSTPRAVVIHLTYLNEENQVMIRHFTSETNDSISNVQGKFAEAATKAVTFCRQKGLKNSAISELESYYDNQHYPGLGTVKKLSIKNHLLTISQYLKST